jgi:hypothetical protein
MLSETSGNVYACGVEYNEVYGDFVYWTAYTDCSEIGEITGTFTKTGESAVISFSNGEEFTIGLNSDDDWVIENSEGNETGWLYIEGTSSATISTGLEGQATDTVTQNVEGEIYEGTLYLDAQIEVADETSGDIKTSYLYTSISSYSDTYPFDVYFANEDDLAVSVSFYADVKASATSPLLGISANWSSSNIHEVIEAEEYSGLLTLFNLSYDNATYQVTLDYDTGEVVFANESGNIVLSIFESDSSTIGSIKVDGVKQADIRETATEIQAVFTDGEVRVIATEM